MFISEKNLLIVSCLETVTDKRIDFDEKAQLGLHVFSVFGPFIDLFNKIIKQRTVSIMCTSPW